MGRPEIVDFGVWAAPAGPKTIPEGGGRGATPTPSGMVVVAAGAAQSPEINDFRPAQKPIIKNPPLSGPHSSAQNPLILLKPVDSTDPEIDCLF